MGAGAAAGQLGSAPTWRDVVAGAASDLGDPQEARWIVQHAAGLSPSGLLSHFDDAAPPDLTAAAAALVERRRRGEPLQWVLGEWGFRGLEVAVDGRALVPRPETEIVVEHALRQLRGAGPPARVADLGTGSGVIALSIACECPDAEVVATDTSVAALALAHENLARLDESVHGRVRFAEGAWFGALLPEDAGTFAVVVSNPPYLAASEWPSLEPVVRRYDPYEALVAGPTGLEAIQVLVAEAPRWLHAQGSLVVEIAPHQRDAVLALVAERGAYASVEVAEDLAGRPRVLVARAS